MSKQTVTIDEAALMLGIHRNTAYRQAQSGSLAGVPVIKVGKSVRVPKAPLERVLAGADA